MDEETYTNLIREDFSKNSSSYDLFSEIQQLVSKKLIIKNKDRILNCLNFTINAEAINSIPNVFDIGCGTGFIGKIFQEEFPQYLDKIRFIQSDLSSAMCKKAKLKNNFETMVADFNNLPFEHQTFNIILSSLSLHWAYNIENSLKKILPLLKNKAIFFFAIPTNKSLIELQESYKNLDIESTVFKFMDFQSINSLLEKLKQESKYQLDFDIERINYVLHFKDFFSFLNSIKKIGGRNKHNQSPKTNQFLNIKKLKNYYEKYYKNANQKIFCSWEITFVTIYLT